MRILPDRTGCNHIAVEIMGIYQCSRCSRLFKLVTLADGKWLAADLSEVAPGAEFDMSDLPEAELGPKTAAMLRSRIRDMKGRESMSKTCTSEEVKAALLGLRDDILAANTHERIHPMIAMRQGRQSEAGQEFDVALAELEVDAVYKLGLVRDMLPGLEESRATEGVARRLKVILGGD